MQAKSDSEDERDDLILFGWEELKRGLEFADVENKSDLEFATEKKKRDLEYANEKRLIDLQILEKERVLELLRLRRVGVLSESGHNDDNLVSFNRRLSEVKSKSTSIGIELREKKRKLKEDAVLSREEDEEDEADEEDEILGLKKPKKGDGVLQVLPPPPMKAAAVAPGVADKTAAVAKGVQSLQALIWSGCPLSSFVRNVHNRRSPQSSAH